MYGWTLSAVFSRRAKAIIRPTGKDILIKAGTVGELGTGAWYKPRTGPTGQRQSTNRARGVPRQGQAGGGD
ncbi:hypothetical protein LCGC14_3106810 [marine sediment metagenome]|uniref:Uncharacterized protein n=1 Tax=marine sediment metagenome TaxID=412755 RepID=A0A0F8W6B7_9ZZZZ